MARGLIQIGPFNSLAFQLSLDGAEFQFVCSVCATGGLGGFGIAEYPLLTPHFLTASLEISIEQNPDRDLIENPEFQRGLQIGHFYPPLVPGDLVSGFVTEQYGNLLLLDRLPPSEKRKLVFKFWIAFAFHSVGD
ncbi:MAG: hypothetical protein H0V90_10285 [Blastocatellia bacterium]|nr:hypothetical protein [Blastocatellia bacterium]